MIKVKVKTRQMSKASSHLTLKHCGKNEKILASTSSTGLRGGEGSEDSNDVDYGAKLSFSSLTNDKILDWSKSEALADDKIKVAKLMIFVFDRIENIVGKGENAGYQHFLLFPQCIKRLLFQGR